MTQLSSERAAGELSEAPGWREVVNACASVSWVVVPKSHSYARCVASLPTRTPLRVAYCRSPAFARTARQLVHQHGCDVLHVDRKRIAPNLESLPLPKVLDATDSIALYAKQTLRYGSFSERLVSVLELLKVPPFEVEVCAGFSACLATTEEDARALGPAEQGTRLEVLPNGVDGRLFGCAPRGGTDSLLFVGTMNYFPNVDAATWFAERVFPRIRAARPRVRLRLVGSKPNRAVRRLARVPGVEVTGMVPNVVPYLESATVFVAPMRVGGGFPNKVAEALAAKLPTVATPAAYAGIAGLVPGTHLLAATSPEEFASRTLRLLGDADLRNRLGSAGREFMHANYGWDRMVDSLEGIYASVLAT